MASRIKGITVEIGGDTSGLEKSLSDVNNSIKKTQSQLRDVNNLLKLDPSNTVLLAQKQELLQSAIGDTEKKLQALEQAQDCLLYTSRISRSPRNRASRSLPPLWRFCSCAGTARNGPRCMAVPPTATRQRSSLMWR